ncbi:PqqD family protein [Metabacillus sp. KIGAM252]|uniref:PqqD family protein n=1 Tax=Metabacillus flavus TaxID=2823519 RepID=A0ABS5LFW0_9BACI|nr:PqqD family protein [Metabacillus flavus]MBS2969635.1 PqqD family protein [Metabacillus flavus]
MTKYIRKHGHEALKHENSWIVLNSEAFTVTALNETGGYCWQLLKHPQTDTSLVRSMKEQFQTEGDQMEEDVRLFLVNLLELDLIENAG